ncbi:GGDEF domain-containing protein [Pseudocitrobacter corydidari]|uniref:diguanylate cyclase n=1 Tax=Pseudocitrobacter corydidari TaxID=2891570 RepID=A0ABY3S104_9ENTR|nr:GGDEF domain-containing protein [Pseudocitrobacter corydidari]UGS40366.1 hypothetical protein G163CM_10640 [Pseudocitrobacter corydidari]
MLMKLKFPLQRFLVYFTICIIGIVILNHFSAAIIHRTPTIAPLLFPILTMFLMVFHAMIAAFMVMKYSCDKHRLYLTPIAFAFAGSAILMLGTLDSFPDWFMCTGLTRVNYNDTLIFYFFRNIMMAFLFIFAVILYAFKKREMHTFKIHTIILVGILLFTLGMLLLSWLYSSHYELLSVDFVDNNTYQFTQLWGNQLGWILIALWVIALLAILVVTQLNNIFWYSGAFFCACYIFTLIVLMSSGHSAGYTWYEARLFETISTMFLILVLLCDVFTLYRQSNTRYMHSYQNSIRDPLTQLFNRSYFYDTFTALMPKVATGQPISVIVSDLDHFKRINDKYGHLQGDKVIQFVSKVLQDSVRQNDVAARIGGEEFALLLVGASSDVAEGIAERIRVAIASQDAESSQSQLPEPITISMGVFTATDLTVNVEECVRRADEAMYRAKEAGRNRVVVWE